MNSKYSRHRASLTDNRAMLANQNQSLGLRSGQESRDQNEFVGLATSHRPAEVAGRKYGGRQSEQVLVAKDDLQLRVGFTKFVHCGPKDIQYPCDFFRGAKIGC